MKTRNAATRGDRPAIGLRERKKARTRATIQREALRLFRDQGYDATPVSQIAEEAEVSESTFFRYFPTKEDVILWDAFDPALVEKFRAQPAELGPLAALRVSIRELLGTLTSEEVEEQRQRALLLLSVPPLRATLVDHISGPMRLLAELIGERVGRPADDPSVGALAGAVLGVSLSVMIRWMEDPGLRLVDLVDEAVGMLESGFRLD
ncbi:MAG TPA: TetR family transcriptional regulator [Candidatus Dormibacteraeota bacterium]|jgi:AcrR family transcriptional regulator|nr:TetR family transcriptional regulator [Candidatus Dormibacteraeota bacterium]